LIGKLNNEYWSTASILSEELNMIINLKISLKGIILLVIYSIGEVKKVRERNHLKDLDVD
jgi:hypothetical protein